ncbi:MAG: DNA methyltransferase [Rhodothermales bacterium]
MGCSEDRPAHLRPWRERIAAETTLEGLLKLRDELLQFRVLDPACGSGNFLYVSYREMKRLEIELLSKIRAGFSDRALRQRGVNLTSRVNVRQMYGLDVNPFAVELAKVTLTIAKELALREAQETAEADLTGLLFDVALPLDDLDQNVRQADALFSDWPEADAIVGNPPFQSKNKMQEEFSPAYVNRLRQRYPDVPGRADYCVFWFRRTHDYLGEGQLVGTNTIRQNESREGGLDYIEAHGGTITEAVASQVWSGDASVHVSLVNWIKGQQNGTKKLYRQVGDSKDSPFEAVELDHIPPTLSDNVDVRSAKALQVNRNAGACYQGQTHGHRGFLLTPREARRIVKTNSQNADVFFPYMTGNNLLTTNPIRAKRYVIDFHPRDMFASAKYKEPFERVREQVLPTREAKAKEEEIRNAQTLQENANARVNRHHQNFLKAWWQLSYARGEMISKIEKLPRYFACSNTTKRSIFEFLHPSIRPNAKLQVFCLPDDYSFGVISSGIHWVWLIERCTTLGATPTYTSRTVWDTFPWPQAPMLEQVEAVAEAAVALRAVRREIMAENDLTLRELYRMLEEFPGANPLADAHARLDAAVRAAYGMATGASVLAHLLALNHAVAARETAGESVVGPGLPPTVSDPERFITEDCIQAPPLGSGA